VYRLKMVSNVFGIDDKSPIYPTLESAREVAQLMVNLYHGKVRVEIYQIVDANTHQRRLVETLGRSS
jgi:hypothetical protein